MTAVSNNIQGNNHIKALTYQGGDHSKRLSGAGVEDNSPLGTWYREAHAYYNAVMSGAEKRPDAAAWNEFINQMNWAYEQLQGPGSSSDVDFDMGLGPVDPEGMGEMGEAADPFGGEPGPMGNLTYTDPTTRLGFIGEERPMDIWSSEFILDVSDGSATVTFEKTMDTRFDPAEEVYKMIVTSKATKKTSTYFLHDISALTKVQINTPSGQKVTGHENYPVVSVGKYKKPSDADARPESSHPFEAENGKNVIDDVPLNEVVQLNPAANGENEVWDIYANYNISTTASDKVVVTKTGENTYSIVVTHRNGETDTYLTHAGLSGNIDALPENVTFQEGRGPIRPDRPVVNENVKALTLERPVGFGTGASYPGTDGVPSGWENLTLNSSEGAYGEDVEQLGDDPTRMDGDKRVYDGQDFSIYPVPEGKGEETEIDASGTVTITPNSNSEYFEILLEGNQFVINVFSKSPYTAENIKETIRIDADLVKTLDLTKIDYTRILNPIYLEDQLEKKYQDKLRFMGENGQEASNWPSYSVIRDNIPQYQLARQEVTDFLQLLGAAVEAGPNDINAWNAVKEAFNGIDSDYRNDAVRCLLTALNKVAGGDNDKFNSLLKMIPRDVRRALKEGLYRTVTQTVNGQTQTSYVLNEGNEWHDDKGELYSSQMASDILDRTLDE